MFPLHLLCPSLANHRGRMAPSGARPSTGPEKRSAPRAGQRLAGAVARRWRPPARSLRGRDRRYSARVSLVSVEVVVLGAGERATRGGLDRLLLLATKDAAAQGLVDGRNKCAYSPWKDTAKIAEAVLTVYHSIVAPEPARYP